MHRTARVAISLSFCKRGARRGAVFLQGLVAHVHGENGGTAANIENDLVLKNVLVLHNGVHIRSCSDLIFLKSQEQHGQRIVQYSSARAVL